jgi:hypothetical protein
LQAIHRLQQLPHRLPSNLPYSHLFLISYLFPGTYILCLGRRNSTVSIFIMSEKLSEKAADPTEMAPNEQSSTSTSTAKPMPSTVTGAESPRTAREPDFDDDVPDTHLAPPERQTAPAQKKRVSFQDDGAPNPPPKPPRPMSPNAQAEATLIEAFPTMDVKIVKAVLVASGGKVEPAFNALLGMRIYSTISLYRRWTY